jgi:hypothetical protein
MKRNLRTTRSRAAGSWAGQYSEKGLFCGAEVHCPAVRFSLVSPISRFKISASFEFFAVQFVELVSLCGQFPPNLRKPP